MGKPDVTPPVFKTDQVDKFVFCGRCRKHIEEKEECSSLGVALDYEIRWHKYVWGDTFQRILSICTCFSCDDCGKSLIGVDRKKAENDDAANRHRLYCGDCYINAKSPVCSRCLSQINKEDSWELFGGTFYHTKCYTCESCSRPLNENGAVVDNEAWVCPSCFVAQRDFAAAEDQEQDDIMKHLANLVAQGQSTKGE